MCSFQGGEDADDLVSKKPNLELDPHNHSHLHPLNVTMQTDAGSSARPRTSVACGRCNARKVKCTASLGIPCSRCRSSGSECVLIDSQRGKYTRSRLSEIQHGGTRDESRQSQASRSSQALTRRRSLASSPSAPPAEQHPHSQSPRRAGDKTPIDSGSKTQPSSPNSFYAQIAEQRITEHQSLVKETTETVFLGEAFSLTYVVHDVLAPFLADSSHFQRRLHFPLATKSRTVARSSIVKRQIEHLRAARLWFYPAPQTLDSLLSCYFDHFHPAFPIAHRSNFISTVARGEASLLVLNAVLMIAATICDDDLLAAFPGVSRHELRRHFYRQARSIYDSDLESDKFDTIFGVFLVSFWWDGPDDQKDTWHWLSVATSLAQSLGMHRSMQFSHVDQPKSKNWKRLWWSIRIRDTLVSGSIGRPQHFSDLDCDIELPALEDVAEAIGHASGRSPAAVVANVLLEMDQEKEALECALSQFRALIPATLVYHGVSCDGKGLWSAMLLMALKYVLNPVCKAGVVMTVTVLIVYNTQSYASILTCRPPRSAQGLEPATTWGNVDRATDSAIEITRVMEDFLTSSAGRLCQIHTIPAIFNALAIHLLVLCTSSKIRHELAENRWRICMLGLSVMQESWPVGGWVYRFFATIMDRLKAKSSTNRRDTAQTGHEILKGQGACGDSASTHELTWPMGENAGLTPYRVQENGDKDAIGEDQRRYMTRDGLERSFTPDLFLFADSTDTLPLDQSNFFDMLDGLSWG
ncbi:hypothetical protein G7046_g205 [Stylonectria norvegica]|nr:hypothetical protein G7046_g205 [Stylonectria norvegica]